MKKSDFTTIGASAHTEEERAENDFYATHPDALKILLNDTNIQLNNVWECACGEGHLAEVLRKRHILSKASDLIDRGYGNTNIDFFKCNTPWDGDILTNPPFNCALEFCKHALNIITDNNKVIMLMRIQFLEGQKRKIFLLENPPKYVYVSSSRLLLAKNGDFVKYNTPSANCYAWYIWEKGFKGETTLRWFN